MNNPLVSVVMPVYNVEKYVEKAINSVLNQTYSNFELILINDGSEDNSLEICKRLAREDSRISIIDKINEGVSKARNDGIEKANGEYILFVDSDDDIKKDMIEILVEKIQKSNSDLVLCGYNYNVMENNRLVSSLKIFSQEKTILKNNLIKSYTIELMTSDLLIHSIWNKLYKMEIIKKFNIRYKEDLDFGEDLFFSLEYIYNIDSLDIVKQCLYNYYQYNTGNNLTSKYRNNKFNIIKIWMKRLDWFSEDITDSKTLDYISWLKTRWTLSCCAYIMHMKKSYKDKRAEIIKILESTDFDIANSSINIGYKKFILEKIVYSKNVNLIYLLSLFLFLFKQKFKKIYTKKITHNV